MASKFSSGLGTDNLSKTTRNKTKSSLSIKRNGNIGNGIGKTKKNDVLISPDSPQNERSKRYVDLKSKVPEKRSNFRDEAAIDKSKESTAQPNACPESPSILDTTQDDPEMDDLAGLKLFSQEAPLDTSIDGDSQCEVRWDCYSPETVKQLKKLRGQYNVEGVKRIVAHFNDAHVKPPKPSAMKLMPLPGPGPSTIFKDISTLPKRTTRSSRRPQRSTSRKAVQEMILLLKGRVALQEQEASNKDPQVGNQSDEANNKSICSGGKKEIANNDEEDCWSDDDLFQDNSFLIEATQNPEKFINTSFDMSQVCARASTKPGRASPCSRVAETRKSTSENQSESPNSSIIPSSCVQNPANRTGRQTTVNCSSTFSSLNYKPISSVTNSRTNWSRAPPPPRQQVQSTLTTKHAPLSHNIPKTNTVTSSKPSTAYSAKFTSSVNKFANHNLTKPSAQHTQSPALTQANQTSTKGSQIITTLTPGAKVKTSFRKFNSFQVDSNNHKSANVTSGTQKSSSIFNNSFKRTMSFDSSACSVSNTTKYTPKPVINTSSTSSGVRIVPAVFKANVVPLKHPTSGGLKTVIPPSKSVPPQKSTNPEGSRASGDVTVTDDGFDMSLGDDILQQLDEIFDSQADILATGTACAKAPPAVTSVSNSNKQTTPTFTASSTVTSPDMTSPPTALTALKSVSSLATGSLRSNTPVRPFKQRGSLLEPNASTPAKLAKSAVSPGAEAAASDSGMELFDSFLTEDVYESQILPFLEKIESGEATADRLAAPTTAPAAQPTVFSPSPVKCSPEEIEQKRQAALQRRSLRLSQMKTKTGSR